MHEWRNRTVSFPLAEPVRPIVACLRRSLGRRRASLLTLAALLAATPPAGAQQAVDAPPPPPPADADGPIKTIEVRSNADKTSLNHDVTAGALGTRTALDTPFSVSAVTSSQVQAAQVTDINGVFQYDSGIKISNSGTGQASGAAFTVRGIAIDVLNGYKVDGLAVPYWSIDLPLAQFDQVQILKGLGGFMYGIGSVGGTVNFVTKRPTADPILSVDAGIRSDDIFEGHIDAGGPLNDTDSLGYRLNLNWEDGNGFNRAYVQDHAVSLALDARLSDTLKWTFDGFYEKTHQNDDVNTVSVGSKVTSLAPVGGRTDLAADGDWKTNDMFVLTSGLEWHFAEDWKASASYRYSKLDENYAGNLDTIIDNKGDYLANAFFVQRVFWYNQAQAVVEGTVTTGPFTHQLDFGASYQKIQFDLDTQSLTTHPLGEYNIYSGSSPTLAAYPASKYDPKLYVYNEYYQTAGFVTDTIGFERWSLIAGLRYTAYDDVNRGRSGAVAGSFFNHPVTPTVALTYQAAPQTNVYFSYVQALQNGGEAGPTNRNFPASFGPIESQQYEVGAKTVQANWTAEAALFRIEQGADYTNAENYFVQNGQLQYQGAELSGTYQPAPDWTLLGSLGYLDARNLQAAPGVVGNEVPAASRIQLAGKLHYDVPQIPGFGVDFGARYTGPIYDNAANTLRLSGYTTEELGASYTTELDGSKLTLRGAVKNLSDERYWVASAAGGTAFPGDPRTFTFSVHVDF